MPPTAASADAAATSSPRTLTLPAPIIATLSPRPYLLSHLQSPKPTRPNGRSPSSFRSPSCTTSSLSNCAGSAVVRVGDTAVACGIQAELLYAKDIADTSHITHTTGGQNHDRDPDSTLQHLQLLVPNIDLATGCSPQHLPGSGGPPSTLAQTLSHRLYRQLLVSRLVGLDDLAITHRPLMNDDAEDDADEEQQEQEPETVAYWTLYASLTVLSLAGTTSLLDALWACLVAALADCRLPHAWWDADREMVLCSDLGAEARKLRLRGRPFMSSWGVFEGRAEDAYMRAHGEDGNKGLNGAASAQGDKSLPVDGKTLDHGRQAWYLADPDAFEDALCREAVSVTVDCSGGQTKIVRTEKGGGGVIGMQEMSELIKAAEERWKTWDDAIPR